MATDDVPTDADAFDWLVRADRPAPEARRFRTFRDLLGFDEANSSAQATSEGARSEETAILAGEIDAVRRELSLADLRRIAAHLAAWAEDRGIGPGGTVAVVRLPESAELPLAAAALGLIAAGRRVLLPLGFSASSQTDFLARADARAALSFADRHPSRSQSEAIDALESAAETVGIPHRDLRDDVDLLDGDATPDRWPDLDPDRQVVVFSTSGSTGRPKLVPYTERALLDGLQIYEEAELFEDGLLGGPTAVPMLSHTMGFRELLQAVWNRETALFIRPEWLEKRPYRVVSLALEHPPAHLTLGPALLDGVGQLVDEFSVLEERVAPAIRCIVSSGTAIADGLGRPFPNARLANAFGTTETQQATTTLLGGDASAGDLGRPLPGVSLAVDRSQGPDGAGRLYVDTPHGGVGYLREGGELDRFPDWRDTGDIVRIESNELRHVGRAETDFLNTGIGLKVPRGPVENAFDDTTPEIRDLAVEAPARRDGLVAVVFVDEEAGDPELQTRVAEAFAHRHRELEEAGRDLAFEWAPIRSVGLVDDPPPRRGPGKLDRQAVRTEHADLIEALERPEASHEHAVDIPADPDGAARRYLAPRRSRLLEAFRLDVDYSDTSEASRDRLVRETEKGPRDVLDLVGGWGSNLLGHGREDLRETAEEALDGVPMLDQLSGRRQTADFARRLGLRIGRETNRRWVVCPASTGAEAVDLALEHAALRRHRQIRDRHDELRRAFGADHPDLVDACVAHNESLVEETTPVVVALDSGFHGTTVGAHHLLGDDEHRDPLAPFLAADTVFLDPRGTDEARRQLETLVDEETLPLVDLVDDGDGPRRLERPISNLLATFAEPILGEGGIVEVPWDWLCELKVDGVPFVVDEIQSGLGRSGAFLASSDPETGRPAPADCLLFGKSLGGGVAKVSAMAVDRSHYIDAFDDRRRSTFAGDSLSSSVASRVLEVVDEEEVPNRARDVGRELTEALEQLQADHPDVLVDIRGRGAMIGVELNYPNDPPSLSLRSVAERGLGFLAATYLLHRHDLRVYPTTSAPDTLRCEPSAFLSSEEIDWFVEGLDAFCEALETSNLVELTLHLVDESAGQPEGVREIAAQQAGTKAAAPHWTADDEPTDGATRVAFINHPLSAYRALMADAPVTAMLSTEQCHELVDLIEIVSELKPQVSFSRSLYGGDFWLVGITLPVSPLTMEHLYRRGRTALPTDRIQEAVEMAADFGCEAATFGGFNSIVTDDATRLRPANSIQLSSGNTFTAAVTLHQLTETAPEAGIDFDTSSEATVAVVGALGNIGSAVAEVLGANRLPNSTLLLAGREGSDDRLHRLRQQLQTARRDLAGPAAPDRIATTTDLQDLRRANLIVAAVGSAEPIIFPKHLAEDQPVVLADLSQPIVVDDSVEVARPNVRFLESGLVRLPEDDDFVLSPEAPPGTLFACAAEALLMARTDRDLDLTGTIEPENIETLFEVGRRMGLLDDLVVPD